MSAGTTQNLVSIVYHSKKGHTSALARAVARGAESVEGVQVLLIPVEEVDQRWDDLQRSDAILFGCPTYMGSASAGFKEFMEKTYYEHVWGKQKWKDKIAGGFTNSASQSGDKMTTLFQLVVFASQLCMVWVGVDDPPGNNHSRGSPDDINRLGASVGAMSQSDADLPGGEQSPRLSDQKTAEHYGRRVAEVALHWRWARKKETKYLAAY